MPEGQGPARKFPNQGHIQRMPQAGKSPYARQSQPGAAASPRCCISSKMSSAFSGSRATQKARARVPKEEALGGRPCASMAASMPCARWASPALAISPITTLYGRSSTRGGHHPPHLAAPGKGTRAGESRDRREIIIPPHLAAPGEKGRAGESKEGISCRISLHPGRGKAKGGANTVPRLSPGSHQAVTRLAPGSHQPVPRLSPGCP